MSHGSDQDQDSRFSQSQTSAQILFLDSPMIQSAIQDSLDLIQDRLKFSLASSLSHSDRRMLHQIGLRLVYVLLHAQFQRPDRHQLLLLSRFHSQGLAGHLDQLDVQALRLLQDQV